MNAVSRRNDNSNRGSTAGGDIVRERTARKLFLPALVAFGSGCGLIPGTSAALELGELQVQSTLGQPLRASVAYALQPNEQIHRYCIYLRPGQSSSGLPSISNAAITLRDGTIRLAGRTAIKEPLLSLQLTVDCPYTAHLRREYSVFLDPALPGQPQAPAAAVRTRAPGPAVATAVEPASVPRAATAAASRPDALTPVASGGTYRVQAGDALSTIAAGIPGRNVSIWQAVDALFAANPGAFINNDMNLMRSGALLRIPDSILAPRRDSSAAPSAAARPQAQPAVYEPRVSRATDPSVIWSEPAAATAAAGENTRTPVQPPRHVSQQRRVEQPVSGSPFVAPVDSGDAPRVPGSFAAPADVIPQTSVQNAPPPRSAPGSATTSDSWSWLIWLGGSGIALIIGLLLFGRRLKERFAPAVLHESFADRRSANSPDLDDTDVSPALGLPAAGTAPMARLLSLDADLHDGAGFGYGNDIDVAQDFGFSDSGSFETGLDMDLTGAATREVETATTNIIPPRRLQEESIVVSETPPRHDDSGTYDVSMIVDATKQALGDSDDPTKDLRAVQVDAEGDGIGSDEDTVSEEVDYRVLEQDYEEEMTATQALNADIARAARALSRQLGKDEMGDTLADTMSETEAGGAGDETEETAQMPSLALSLEDTANDATVEVESATPGKRKARAS